MTAPRSTAAPESLSTFPVKAWDRYEVTAFLGAGGMGRVFRARDPRLRRSVALKLLRDAEPKHIERLVREARAQARIDHKHICKVYEVGDVEGLPYIAMQYIDGLPLRDIKAEMTLEEKVRVVKDVAEALHEAHKIGLVHRDIKPGNVMVERGGDGAWIPFLMDFGLARDVGAGHETVTAVVEGTPAYMAPEQVTGGARHVDRRADIYSLGATLYNLLTGRPPFVGSTTVDLIFAMIQGEPTPLRQLDKAIPQDLETIVLKCLERDPSRRYESAKALAEDLGRYLEGDPIKARRATFGYLALKTARKHKLVVAISAAAIASVLLFGGLGIRARLAATEQAALAQELGKDVKEMELFMSYAFGLPLHDTTREKAVILERIARMKERMEQMGALGQGPASYAIGCGYLALYEDEAAREHLERALAIEGGDGDGSGSERRETEVRAALGQALGRLYRRGMDEAQRIPDKPSREARRRELVEQYLAPALDNLQKSRGRAGDSAAYSDALIAFYEGRYDASLAKARAAFAEEPWRYEAKRLEGEIYASFGAAKREEGRIDEASSDLRRALEAYRVAGEMARSHAQVHEAEGRAWAELMAIELNRGASPKVELDQALAACDRAIVASPDRASAFAVKTSAYLTWGNYLLQRGEDPVAALRAAIEAGREAVARNALDATTLRLIGGSYIEIANYEAGQGRDPRPSLDLAIGSFESAVEVNPNHARAWMSMAVAYVSRAEYEAKRGADPSPWLDRSIAISERALSVEPANAVVLSNLCNTLGLKGNYELARGADPGASLDRAVATCERARASNPTFFHIDNNLAFAHLIRARHALATGADPSPSLEEAIARAAGAARLNPGHPEAYQHAAAAHALKAGHELDSKKDPAAALDEGRGMVAKMVEVNATSFQGPLLNAEIELLAARRATARGEPAGPHLEAAEASLRRALASNPKEAEIHQTFAELCRTRAELRWEAGADAGEDIERGLERAGAALAIDPWRPEAMALRGALLALKARSAKDPAERRRSAELAGEALGKALAANPLLRRRYGALEGSAAR